MQYVSFHEWRPSTWLRITGSDALNFLQGQVTNDLRPLGAGDADAVYGLWLNQKGRVLADSFVVAGADGAFWVGSYFSAAEVIRTRLEAYIIADDVVVEDETASWAGVTVFSEAGEAVAAIGATTGGFCFPGRRAGQGCIEWVFPSTAAAQVRAALAGAGELDGPEMERRRITAGIPAVPGDIGPADLPNEGGLELAAISYTKGCYLGQEVMARLKSLGQVRRRLVCVRGATGGVPARSAPLFQGAQKAGEMRTTVQEGEGWVGFAMLTLAKFHHGSGLSLDPDAAPSVTAIDPA